MMSLTATSCQRVGTLQDNPFQHLLTLHVFCQGCQSHLLLLMTDHSAGFPYCGYQIILINRLQYIINAALTLMA